MLTLFAFLLLTALMLFVTVASIPTLFINLALGFGMLLFVMFLMPLLKGLSEHVSESW